MKQKVLDLLDKLNLEYKNYEHKPVFSCSDSKWISIPWKRVKSLLLRNKKATKYYMVVINENKTLDSRELRHTLWENKLSFASEDRMVNKIWVKPGNVSPFANINDEKKDILVIFDKELKNEKLWLHPCQNDNTVVLNNDSVEKYLEYLWVEYKYLEL